ncbi:hypothetical protein, partial [Roseibium sediminis]|uniref:hypothetical protein n=1 Tax=Roseibium sediminis TaxID=1775174 RepID=UPI001956E379
QRVPLWHASLKIHVGKQLRRPKIRTAHPHLSIANHDVIIQPGFERKNQRVIQQPARAFPGEVDTGSPSGNAPNQLFRARRVIQ